MDGSDGRPPSSCAPISVTSLIGRLESVSQLHRTSVGTQRLTAQSKQNLKSAPQLTHVGPTGGGSHDSRGFPTTYISEPNSKFTLHLLIVVGSACWGRGY